MVRNTKEKERNRGTRERKRGGGGREKKDNPIIFLAIEWSESSFGFRDNSGAANRWKRTWPIAGSDYKPTVY